MIKILLAILLVTTGLFVLSPLWGFAHILLMLFLGALFVGFIYMLIPILKLCFHNVKTGSFSTADMRECESALNAEPYARYVGKDIRDSADDLGLAIEDTDETIDIAKEIIRCLDGPYEKCEETYAQRWKASWEEYMATAMLMPYEDVEQAIREGKTVEELSKAYGLPESIVSRRVEDVKFLSEIRSRWR